MRGRVLVVSAFVLAAALCAGAAVALVLAASDDTSPRALGSPSPTSAVPTATPTPAPTTTALTVSPTPSASPVVTASPTATPSRSASPTASPSPRRTATSRPSPTQSVAEGLSAKAGTPGGYANEPLELTAHATDGDGTIYFQSLDWGDGSDLVEGPDRGAACDPAAISPADCRDFAWSHTYTDPGTYIVTIGFVSGDETSILHLNVEVSAAP